MILKIEQYAKREYLKYVVRMRNTQFYVIETDTLNHTIFAHSSSTHLNPFYD